MMPAAGNPLIYVNGPRRDRGTPCLRLWHLRGACMLIQLLVGSAVSAINITLHATVTMIAIRIVRIASRRSSSHPLLHLAGMMIATSLVLMAAHTLEVFVWSFAYAIVNAAPDDANLVYFAFVNYTTLGYGDVTPLAKWRLLGPMTAMNGVLMFGWSTALIFEVLIKTIGQYTSATDRSEKL
jgi:Ion channel